MINEKDFQVLIDREKEQLKIKDDEHNLEVSIMNNKLVEEMRELLSLGENFNFSVYYSSDSFKISSKEDRDIVNFSIQTNWKNEEKYLEVRYSSASIQIKDVEYYKEITRILNEVLNNFEKIQDKLFTYNEARREVYKYFEISEIRHRIENLEAELKRVKSDQSFKEAFKLITSGSLFKIKKTFRVTRNLRCYEPGILKINNVLRVKLDFSYGYEQDTKEGKKEFYFGGSEKKININEFIRYITEGYIEKIDVK